MSSKLHPDGKYNPSQTTTNNSTNNSILEIIEKRQLTRREFLKSSAGTTAGITVLATMGAATMDSLISPAEAAAHSTEKWGSHLSVPTPFP